MSREEFLQILRNKLSGFLSEAQIQSHLQYYSQYITDEVRKGRSEEEVIASLGDPRLIARTLIDASEASGSQGYGTYQEYQEREEPRQQTTPQRNRHILDLSTWYGKLLLILGAVLLIALVVTILSVLLPVILIIVLVSVAARCFRRR